MTQYEHSAGVVLFCLQEGKTVYLLLHYPNGHWDYVKGNREKQETLQQTVLRECQEETGLKHIKFIPGFEETVHYFFKREKDVVAKDVVFLLGMASSVKVRLSSEHTGFVWLPYEKAVEKVTFPNAKTLLKKAHEHLQSI